MKLKGTFSKTITGETYDAGSTTYWKTKNDHTKQTCEP